MSMQDELNLALANAEKYHSKCQDFMDDIDALQQRLDAALAWGERAALLLVTKGVTADDINALLRDRPRKS